MHRHLNRLMLLVALLAPPATAAAQQETATLSGTIRDSSGAVVAGAEITATNTDTNIVSRTNSGADGGFVIASLRPGAYSITVETTGFQKMVRTGVTLQVAQVARFDLVLQAGQITEAVEVRAGTPLLETATSSRGSVIVRGAVGRIDGQERPPASPALRAVEHVDPPGRGVVVVRAEPSGLHSSPLEMVTPVSTTWSCRPGRAGTAHRRRASGRTPSNRSRTRRPGRTAVVHAYRRIGEHRSRSVTVPSASSSTKSRSIAITAPPPRRGRNAAATRPTWRTADGAVGGQRQDVPGQHVDPAQPAPRRRPDRALAVSRRAARCTARRRASSGSSSPAALLSRGLRTRR